MAYMSSRAGWKSFAALLMAAALVVFPALAESQDLNALKARVRELHARASDVNVTLADGATLKGRIVGVEAESFTIRQKTDARDVALQYGQVKDARKSGLSGRTKAILIPAVIVGGAALVLCAAPYPIGFLCRQDPS